MRAAFLLLPLLASTALAQAPVVTPAGDPSVRSDTIYRLAVDPATYPDEPFVYLLDDGIVRFEADGRGTRTFRQVVQVLTQAGAERWGEQVFSYSSTHEKLTVNWIRVLKPDGTVISDKPTHEQESDSPAALDAPVYSDVKLHRATLGGVAPGVLVDYSYTVETTTPVMPGDFYTSWSVTNVRPTLRSRFIVDVPASIVPRIRERNVRFAKRTTEARGRRVVTWATSDVPKPPPGEPFAADSNDVDVGVAVASPERWDDIARWYAGLAQGRDQVTPELDARLAAVVTGAATAADSLRAVHRWVAQDFRYVSVALGIAGYQPRMPAAVLETKYGDCKDKATLFVALARRMGFHAFPVLLSAGGGVDSTLPSVQQFDHMIAAVALDAGRDRAAGATNDSAHRRASSGAVERPGGYRFVDLTADDIPWGELPASEYGDFALLVRPDGRGEQVRLPLDSATANLATDSLVGTLSADGIFAGRLTRVRTGRTQVPLRDALSRTFTPQERAEIARTFANEAFDGADGDSLQLFDGRDLAAPARISVVIRDAQALSAAGSGTSILRLPLRPLFSTGQVDEVASHAPRRYPIDMGQVLGPGAFDQVYLITLPEGWRAHLPDSVRVTGLWGVYASRYAQDGRVLRIERTGSGVRGIQTPDKVASLVAFLRAIARDDARFLVLQH